MSAVVLAGGKSSRMGTDKAFLDYAGRTFISLITDELLRLVDDVVVAIGRKDRRDFGLLLRDRRIRIINDTYYFENPVGGILSALEQVMQDYSFVVACDSPLIQKSLVEHLYYQGLGYSGAIPIWDEADPMTCEPLCGVYNVEETISGISELMKWGQPRCKDVILSLPNVRYVPVEGLRRFDPSLNSLLNINSPSDYIEILENRICPIMPLIRAPLIKKSRIQ
jgi:molybdopterin-guanine dinucleotide biosynthesis protein A